MNFACTRCRAHVAPGDVNANTKIARCAACGHAFDARPQLAAAVTSAGPRPPAAARRAAIDVIELPTPEGREPGYRGSARRGGELEIRHKWASAEIASLLAIGLFWNGIRFASGLHGLPVLQAVLLTVGVVGAAFFGYCAAALHFNKTVVRATPRAVTVRHEPLPWPGNRSVAAHEIKRFGCEAVAPKGPLRPSQTFALAATLHDGRKVRLLSGLPDRDQALAIERRLEQHLDASGGRSAVAMADAFDPHIAGERAAASGPRVVGERAAASGPRVVGERAAASGPRVAGEWAEAPGQLRAARGRNGAPVSRVGDELDESSDAPAPVELADGRARDI